MRRAACGEPRGLDHRFAIARLAALEAPQRLGDVGLGLGHERVVVLVERGTPQVHGYGLPLDEDYDAFVAEAEADIAQALGRLKGGKARDRETVIEAARLAARRAAQRWSGKKPQTRVILTDDAR